VGIVDVTESRRLMSEVSEQRRLLDLVIDHMSDAIVLIGIDRRVIQANHRLLRMLNLRLDNVTGQRFDPAAFWSTLGLVDPQRAFDRMGQLLDQPGTAAQEQYEADDGTYQFQVIPVCDEIGNPVAQLWVVQEVSAQLRSARMIDQQAEQLRAIQQMGRALHEVDGVDHLLDRVAAQLYQIMDVEAVGIALRQDDRQRRCAQRVQLAGDQTRLATGAAVAQAVYRQLMPRVLDTRDTSYWADLSQQSDWAGAFAADGIEALAATLLHMEERCHGVIWIARRGGRRIERHHLYLLEALAPIISNSLENAQLRQRMTALRLTDSVTALPAGEQFDLAVRKLVNRPGEPWSLLLVDIDHFQRFNDQYGHEAADQILRKVATALRDICRASDQACRLKADQFAVLCASTTAEMAGELAERIRGHVSRMSLDDLVIVESPGRDRPEHVRTKLTCSIGIAASPTDHTAGEVLLSLAEARLQAAKAGGRNRIGDAGTADREAG
jgi:diguanylate cyclase (GGDEF)-like protein